MNLPTVPYPEDFTPHSQQFWEELILGPIPARVFCPQCHRMTLKEDFEPRAGMCGACISEAMNEAGDFFSRRGLVASIEEQTLND